MSQTGSCLGLHAQQRFACARPLQTRGVLLILRASLIYRWEQGSYGFHGDDGHIFHAAGVGEEYGPKWGTGDTVGAGLHLGRQEIFFT